MGVGGCTLPVLFSALTEFLCTIIPKNPTPGRDPGKGKAVGGAREARNRAQEGGRRGADKGVCGWIGSRA